MEGVSNIRVHSDHEVLLLRDGFITHLNLVMHPTGELALEHGGADVTEPLLGDFVNLLRVRHVVEHMLAAVIEELGDVLEREAIIQRYLDMSHILGLDTYNVESC